MTAGRHSAVRITAAEPCPFCGCGLAMSGHTSRPRRKGHTGRVRYRGPAYPFENLPAEWRAVMRSTMKTDPGALAATKALNDAIAAKQAEGFALVAKPTHDGQKVAPTWVKVADAAEVAA